MLRTQADPVKVFDAELRRLVKDLTETMLDAPGVGLAAPQIGVSLRVFTFHVDDQLGHLINPSLSLSDEAETDDEGCLSFPGLYYECTRAERVVVAAVDVTGAALELTAAGLLARIFQHEIDHLDGVLFIDRLPRAERKLAMRAWRERELDLEPAGAEPHLHVPAQRPPVRPGPATAL